MSGVLNAEKLIAIALRADPALSDARFVATTPSRTDTPWVRITQLDATDDATSSVERWIEYYLQLDIYAGADGGVPEANNLNRLCRLSLKALQGTTLGTDAVVSEVRFTSNPRIPDSDVDEPARERFVLDTTIPMRPL